VFVQLRGMATEPGGDASGRVSAPLDIGSSLSSDVAAKASQAVSVAAIDSGPSAGLYGKNSVILGDTAVAGTLHATVRAVHGGVSGAVLLGASARPTALGILGIGSSPWTGGVRGGSRTFDQQVHLSSLGTWLDADLDDALSTEMGPATAALPAATDACFAREA
jgi:hypothetical protein